VFTINFNYQALETQSGTPKAGVEASIISPEKAFRIEIIDCKVAIT